MPPKGNKRAISPKVVARMSRYRRLLLNLLHDKTEAVYSHELARLCGSTAPQVRKDLVTIRCSGCPAKGYNVRELLEQIQEFLDAPDGQQVALVGVGNLGRAILGYFAGRRLHLNIAAAFDRDPEKVDRVVHGCRCHHLDELASIVREKRIDVAILAVPAAAAQELADQLVLAGVRGILNFVPVPLRVPRGVYVEDADMTSSLECVAFFAREGADRQRNTRERHNHTG